MKTINALCIIAFTLAATGCGIPNGALPGKDTTTSPTTHTTLNHACDGLDLSRSEFSPRMLRTLTSCLNKNKQLGAVADLVDALPDEDLGPVAEIFNRTILLKPERLYQLIESAELLQRKGLLKQGYASLSSFLRNGDFISASVGLLKRGYFSGEPLPRRLVADTGLFDHAPNTRLLTAFEELGKDLTNGAVEEALDYGLTIAESRVFGQLQTHFKEGSRAGQTSETIAASLVRFLQISRTAGHPAIGERALRLLSQDRLWSVLTDIVGDGVPGWETHIPEWSRLTQSAYNNKGQFFDDLPELFSALRETESHPISCLRDTAAIAGLTPRKALQEIDTLSLKQFLLTLAVARPVCEFPKSILTSAKSLMPLANSDASQTLESWVRAFNKDQDVADLVIDLLSEKESRLKALSPVIAELQAADALNDFWLLSALLQINHRGAFNKALDSITQYRSALGGQSIFNTLVDAASDTQTADIKALLDASHSFLKDGQKIAAPALSFFRDAYYSSDVHPVVDWTRDLFKEAKRNEQFFTSLLRIAGKHPVRFAAAVHEISQMAAPNDGRLAGLTLSLAKLFRPAAERGHGTIHETLAPAFVPRAKHFLVGYELPALQNKPRRGSAYEACKNFDFGFSLSDYKDSAFTSQFSNFVGCITSYENDLDIERSLNFLTDAQILSNTSGPLKGHSLYSWIVEQTRAFTQSTLALKEATVRFLNATRDGTISALINAFPLLTERSGSSASAVETLLELIHKTTTPPASKPGISDDQKIAKLRELKASVCTVLKQDSDDIGALECEWLPIEDAIKKQLSIWEPDADTSKRTREIMEEFLFAVELDYRKPERVAPQGHKLQTKWKKEYFFEEASQLYTWLVNARTKEEDPQDLNKHKTIEGFLFFLKGFNPTMNPYEADKQSARTDEAAHKDYEAIAKRLTQWMVEEAHRLTVVPYHYNGELKPRVRIFNGLDRLDLLLLNSELTIASGFEPGTVGLTTFPVAWKDEAFETRPPFARDEAYSFTLAEAAVALQQGLSGPKYCLKEPRNRPPEQYSLEERSCISKTKNLRGFEFPNADEDEWPRKSVPSITSLLDEYIDTPNKVCAKATDCFGIKVIRNIFTALYDRSPEEFRPLLSNKNEFIGQKANVKFMEVLADLGLLRRTGQLLFGKTSTDTDLQAFFRSAVFLAKHKDYELLTELAKALVSDDEHTTWEFNASEKKKALTRKTVDLLLELSDSNPDALKDFGFYGVAAIADAGLLEEPTNWLAPILKVAIGSVRKDGGRELLSSHINTLKELLSSDYFRGAVATIYDDASIKNQASHQSQWHAFRAKLQAIKSDPTYPREKLDHLGEEITTFLYHPPSPSQDGGELYRRAIETIFTQIEDGSTEQLARALGTHTGELYGVCSTASRFSREGNATGFIDMIGRTLKTK